MIGRAQWSVLHAAAGGTWRDDRLRAILGVLGIAFGVALGVAVHLINASAANDFGLAVRALAGEADLVIRGPRAGFPEAIYPRLVQHPNVAAASPAIEIDAQLAGRRSTIRVLGLDPFRALQVQPQLLAESREAMLDMLEADAVVLSRAAADELALGRGSALRIQSGTGTVTLRVVGVLAAGATRERIAVMDIANAQWRFGRIGELQRIDLKLSPGSDVSATRAHLESVLPAGVLVTTPYAEAERSASIARAYRTNLDMLALVALFTGAFLVFTTQFLALVRRRRQLALLRVLGVTRSRLVRLLVAEGAVVGAAGASIGIALGCALAQIGVERLGGDLGAGYFRSVAPALSIEPAALVVFFVLGTAFAIAGAALPAVEAAQRAPALALRAGDEEAALRRLPPVAPGLLLMLCAAPLAYAPPVADLPIGGYAAIALLLTGAILVMPRVAELALSRLPELPYPAAALAAAQLRATPRQAAVSLAAILASFSLMVSMLIMVGSFRSSLESWLDKMLPADLYARAGRTGESGYFTPDEQTRIAGVPGVREAVFVRSQNVLVRADRPAVSLLARPLRPGEAQPPLPFERATLNPPPGESPAWLSEVAADLLGVVPGARVALPIGNSLHSFTVAGVWRDYARQNGAIVIDRALYVALTGDERANEAAIFLAPGARAEAVAAHLRQSVADADGLEIASPVELKAISLSLFDRTFAVTYALEIAAVLIGLIGVSAGFSAQALARRGEFGVLRHVGMTRQQVAAMLGCEGLIVGVLGVGVGSLLGWAVSLVLVHVVNRQSFHWSMDLDVPWVMLALLGSTLVAVASLTAIWSGRRAMSGDVIRAVREDW